MPTSPGLRNMRPVLKSIVRRPKPTFQPVGTVVITGASSGIGRCTAGLLARKGWRVGLIARGQAGLQAVRDDVEREGARVMTAQADVTDPDALEAAAAGIERALGPIDVWVNCAGNATYGRFLDTPAEEFRRVTDVTYLGTVNGTRIALQRMMPRDRGRIVNVCSAVVYHGMPLLASYTGAKHAMRGFDQAVRAELLQEGSEVHLISVFPPAVNTPFCDHAISHMGRPGRPMPPIYQPEVVAEAIHLAATGPSREMPVTFTTVLFALGVRLVPALVAMAIRRLGYDGQLTTQAAALARYDPTVFTASSQASPVHGTFGAEARSGSVHLRILRVLAWLERPGHGGRAAKPVVTVRPVEDSPG